MDGRSSATGCCDDIFSREYKKWYLHKRMDAFSTKRTEADFKLHDYPTLDSKHLVSIQLIALKKPTCGGTVRGQTNRATAGRFPLRDCCLNRETFLDRATAGQFLQRVCCSNREIFFKILWAKNGE